MKVKEKVFSTEENELCTIDDVCSDCRKNGEAMLCRGNRHLDYGNYKEAYRFFEAGADIGDADCQYNLALMFLKGDGCRKNFRNARLLLEKSSQNGNPDADYLLGWMYYNGDGVKRDYARSQKLLIEAGEKGSILAKEFWEEMKEN